MSHEYSDVLFITEQNSNVGRANAVASVASAIENALHQNIRRAEIQQPFGELFGNGNPMVEEFKRIAGDSYYKHDLCLLLEGVFKTIGPQLSYLRSTDIPIYISYMAHPNSVLAGLAIKFYFPKTLLISISYPYRAVDWFDIIAAPPYHLHQDGDSCLDIPSLAQNVLPIDAIPTHVNPESLRKEGSLWERHFRPEDDCLIALLIGGPFPAFARDPQDARMVGTVPFTNAQARELCGQALDLRTQILQKEKGRKRVEFLITTSRRTPSEVTEIVHSELGRHARWVFNPSEDRGPNPLLAYLHWSKYIIVTGDSLSMISDALAANYASRAQVIIYAPDSLVNHHVDVQGAHRRFCARLHDQGQIAYLGDRVPEKSGPRIRLPAEVIAARVASIIKKRGNYQNSQVERCAMPPDPLKEAEAMEASMLVA